MALLLNLFETLIQSTPKEQWEDWLASATLDSREILEVLKEKQLAPLSDFITSIPLSGKFWSKVEKSSLVHDLISDINFRAFSETIYSQKVLHHLENATNNDVSWKTYIDNFKNYNEPVLEKELFLYELAKKKIESLTKKDVTDWQNGEKSSVEIVNLLNSYGRKQNVRKIMVDLENKGLVNKPILQSALKTYFLNHKIRSVAKNNLHGNDCSLFNNSFTMNYLYKKVTQYGFDTTYIFNGFSQLYFSDLKKLNGINNDDDTDSNSIKIISNFEIKIKEELKHINKFFPYLQNKQSLLWHVGLFFPDLKKHIFSSVYPMPQHFLNYMKNSNIEDFKEDNYLNRTYNLNKYICQLYEKMIVPHWDNLTNAVPKQNYFPSSHKQDKDKESNEEEAVKFFSCFYKKGRIQKTNFFAKDSLWLQEILKVFPGLKKPNESILASAKNLMHAIEESHNLNGNAYQEFWLKLKYSGKVKNKTKIL